MNRILRSLVFVVVLALLFFPGGARAEPGASGPSTERWYEILVRGEKLGHSCVVWAPSTWEGRHTVHDTTTIVERTVRNMMGIKDVFETATTINLERGDDGTMWWMKVVVEEAGRRIEEEQTWTGKGYVHISRLGDEEQRIEIPLSEPVVTDSEAFLGGRIRAGRVKVGDTFTLRLLDVRARKAVLRDLVVVSREEIADASGGDEDARVEAFKVVETDPASGAETTLWIDDDGAFVRMTTDSGSAYRRVHRDAAETRPVRPAESRITTPATPVLERIMSADRLWVDLHLQGDADRKLPAIPDSPWGRVLGVTGDDENGWVFKMALTAYDDLAADVELPVDLVRFERDLEPTVLMACTNEQIRAAAAAIVGEETSARKAAYLLSRWVFETLDKTSPDVGQASALEILESERGDCSEHALLFVTLCRAAGIPARRCTGYVNVGSQWGAHAWAEIWVGQWIGADPTTGEIGTAARYLFFGYPDDPDSHPGLVSSRALGRLRFVATRIEEGPESWDLSDSAAWYLHDKEHGRYVHVLAGIEAQDVPKDWVVRMLRANRARFRATGFKAEMEVSADQGYRVSDLFGGLNGTFAGRPARTLGPPSGPMHIFLDSRRRTIHLTVQGEDLEAQLQILEKMLAPTFKELP